MVRLKKMTISRTFSTIYAGISSVLLPEPLVDIGLVGTKSLERSPAVGDFYGTRIEIWAGFGPVRQLLRPVFLCFHEQKKI